jgi:CrcB protein
MFITLLQVALGGAIGAVARFLVVTGTTRAFGTGFPMGTLAVNVAGSLAMGMLAALLLGPKAHPAAPFLITGILGGFTTFSAFSLDALRLLEDGRIGSAALYVVLSVVLSLGACAAGLMMMRGSLT